MIQIKSIVYTIDFFYFIIYNQIELIIQKGG